MIESFMANFEEELKIITLGIQKSVKIACFTERLDSAMMWGQYANNATGFALEYEFTSNRLVYSSDLNLDYKVFGTIYPIDYSNNRIDATDYVKYLYQSKLLKNALMMNGIVDDGSLIRFAVPCIDEFMATKIALFKSKDWEPEKEWRMFFSTNDPAVAFEKYPSVIYKPSAIFLGRKISNINMKIISYIAKEKGIPVYRMEIDNTNMTYKLKHQKLENI